jgi:hypothetical protein
MLAHLNLLDLKDFGPCTHVFSFDTGFPTLALQAFAKALNASKNVQVFGSFQKPRFLEAAGFKKLTLTAQIPMKMTSSGEGHTLMVYRVSPEAAAARRTTPSASWDITRLYSPPQQSVYAPNVPHGSDYQQGETARLAGVDSYLAWVHEQMGLERSTGMRTRQRRNQE